MIKDLEFSINLYTEGEKFFDVLKAIIRDSKKSQWPHERERAVYAEELFKRALDTFEEAIHIAETRVEEGLHIEQDLKIIKELKAKRDYWKKKLEEVVSVSRC
ncbi:hypothetical protein [Thermosediminibacter litoriperuensis]|uniref:Uncharacterized protein n=1 Tax=Thermosediminibacter litoriperuensis TaxID=291989 RepID=A0A5S5AUZ9_9FIRM|nr:hypothetical protein [Thermosediminibacter litoriperuensis]TYP56726.1 hypothetical protein LZ11_01007 [Thermosediminibacter litoriperuensis]